MGLSCLSVAHTAMVMTVDGPDCVIETSPIPNFCPNLLELRDLMARARREHERCMKDGPKEGE